MLISQFIIFFNTTAAWVSSLYPDVEFKDAVHFIFPRCNIIPGEYLINICAWEGQKEL